MSSEEHTSVSWIRKRDGEIVRFDMSKLVLSLTHAAENAGHPLSPDVARELAPMARYFLERSVEDSVADTQQITEWVIKSLRETGHERLATSYEEYSETKLRAQEKLRVVTGTGPEHWTQWDKSDVADELRSQGRLDPDTIRSVASSVERQVLAMGLPQISWELVRALTNNELRIRGTAEQLEEAGVIRVSTAALRDELLGNREDRLLSEIWRRFSLAEVVSDDVLAADRAGEVHVIGLNAPSRLAAESIDCSQLVRGSESFRDSITRFGDLLGRAINRSSQVIAIDQIEMWLALVAEPGDHPADTVEPLWRELKSWIQHTDSTIVINLYGDHTDVTDADGAGPLFRSVGSDSNAEFADMVSEIIRGLVTRDAPDLQGLFVDWHYSTNHPLLPVISRMMTQSSRIRCVYDRDIIHLGEGLRRVRGSSRPVLDYVAIDLNAIWDNASRPTNQAFWDEALHSTATTAIRAGVQKREFVRRVLHDGSNQIVDSAVLVIVPTGIERITQELFGADPRSDQNCLSYATRLVQRLRDVTLREARHFELSIVLDSLPPKSSLHERSQSIAGPRQECHSVGQLHEIMAGGTLRWHFDPSRDDNSELLTELLEWNNHATNLTRLSAHPIPQPRTTTNQLWPE